MLAYNGSIPGPTLKVPEGAEIVVNVENQGDMEATVHWHGLRLDNASDGTHETQEPIQAGGSYTCRVAFPDPGAYWYHPHIREDYGQEMGLYGNVLVEPADPDYWPPAHRELAVTLDDILLEDGRVAPFSRPETTHAAMGRFGDVMLVSGETDLSLAAQRGEVVRFYLTNTANTRVFKVGAPGARMKLVGGDSGRVEHEEFVDAVVLAPSERVVVDVLFDEPGELALEHRTPDQVYPLGAITVQRGAGRAGARDEVRRPARQPGHGGGARADRAAPGRRARQEPGVRRRDGSGRAGEARAGRLRLPDAPRGRQRGAGQLSGVRHEADAVGRPELRVRCTRRSSRAGHCPECGMKLMPAQLMAAARARWHEHAEHETTAMTHAHGQHGRRHRVGRRHGRGQPDDDAGEHALEADRPRDRRREHGDRLAVPRRRPGQDPAASTRWTATIRCTTRSTSMARAASWS